MPAASDGAGQSASEQRIHHVLSLLAEALRVLDDGDEFPDVGARLQQIIDILENRSAQRS